MSQGLRFQKPGLSTGGVPLLCAFDLFLPAGALTLLTGPNGAGKSSLLRSLANGVEPVNIHSYLFAGELGLRMELDVYSQALYFAQLYDQQGLASEVLQGSLHQAEVSQEESVKRILNRLGLWDWAEEKVASLSSGQKVRLGLCGLLMSRSKLWLLDEPLNALDSQSIELLAAEISAHLKTDGIVLMASHADVGLLTRHHPDLLVKRYHIQEGSLLPQEEMSSPIGITLPYKCQDQSGFVQPVARSQYSSLSHFGMLIKREWNLVLGNPQGILWSALFHWMILTFFGLSLIKSDTDVSRAAIWVSSLLAVLLVAKDWFTDDQRCGWMGILTQVDRSKGKLGILSAYWVSKVLLSILVQIAAVLPVALIAAIQFGLSRSQVLDLTVSLSLGLAAAAPLLALVSLMVLMTRGGAVLVYVLALPMVVPVMVFGLEGSQAQELGRSAFAPWLVLGSMACLGLLLGPWIARRLMILIQE